MKKYFSTWLIFKDVKITFKTSHDFRILVSYMIIYVLSYLYFKTEYLTAEWRLSINVVNDCQKKMFTAIKTFSEIFFVLTKHNHSSLSCLSSKFVTSLDFKPTHTQERYANILLSLNHLLYVYSRKLNVKQSNID